MSQLLGTLPFRDASLAADVSSEDTLLQALTQAHAAKMALLTQPVPEPVLVAQPANRAVFAAHCERLADAAVERPDLSQALVSDRFAQELAADRLRGLVLQLALQRVLVETGSTNRANLRILASRECDDLRQQQADLELEQQQLGLLLDALVELASGSAFAQLPLAQQQQTLLRVHSLWDHHSRVTQQLEQVQARLAGHRTACLLAGHVEHVVLDDAEDDGECDLSVLLGVSMAPACGVGTLPTVLLDGLLAHVLQVAVERGIALPPPVSNDSSLASRAAWIASCIDAVVGAGGAGPAVAASLRSPESSSDLRTALQDLRFAHEYLSKSFEAEREAFSKAMGQHRHTELRLGEQVAGLRTQLALAQQHAVELEMERAALAQRLAQATHQVNTMHRELGQLKFPDSLPLEAFTPVGNTFPMLLEHVPLAPGHRVVLPLTGERLYARLRGLLMLLMGLVSRDAATTTAASEAQDSYEHTVPDLTLVGILRAEFRKMLLEMEANYELELRQLRSDKERSEREVEALRRGSAA